MSDSSIVVARTIGDAALKLARTNHDEIATAGAQCSRCRSSTAASTSLSASRGPDRSPSVATATAEAPMMRAVAVSPSDKVRASEAKGERVRPQHQESIISQR